MMRRTTAIPVLLVRLLGGCGSEDDGSSGGLVADLRVEVRPEGPGGPQRASRIECRRLGAGAAEPRCRELAGLEPDDLDPVPATTACTQIFGGPATARVTGTLRGMRVNASFDLRNGCEISRWRRNSALLGPPPRA